MSDSLIFFFKGLMMGFAMAAPVGPVGVLCIRRTLRDGRLHGFVTGLAVAVADGFFGLVAGLGLTAISQPLIDHQNLIRLVGGFMMLAMGVQIFRSKPPQANEPEKSSRLMSDFFSAFAITITNPLTILTFAAIYVALGFGAEIAGHLGITVALVLGVFIGSAGWWVLLTQMAAYFKTFLKPEGLKKINHATGILIFCFGIYAVITGANAFI